MLPTRRGQKFLSPARAKSTPFLQRFGVLLSIGICVLLLLLVTIYHCFSVATNHVSAFASGSPESRSHNTLKKFSEDYDNALKGLERLHQHNADTHMVAKSLDFSIRSQAQDSSENENPTKNSKEAAREALARQQTEVLMHLHQDDPEKLEKLIISEKNHVWTKEEMGRF